MRTQFSGWVRRELTEADLIRRIAEATPQDAVIHAVTHGGICKAWVLSRRGELLAEVWRPTVVGAIEAALAGEVVA